MPGNGNPFYCPMIGSPSDIYYLKAGVEFIIHSSPKGSDFDLEAMGNPLKGASSYGDTWGNIRNPTNNADMYAALECVQIDGSLARTTWTT